jgi:hypothetical protein
MQYKLTDGTHMTRAAQEQAIGRDLALCDLIDAIGSKDAKRKTRAHRRACYAQLRAWSVADGTAAMRTDIRN